MCAVCFNKSSFLGQLEEFLVMNTSPDLLIDFLFFFPTNFECVRSSGFKVPPSPRHPSRSLISARKTDWHIKSSQFKKQFTSRNGYGQSNGYGLHVCVSAPPPHSYVEIITSDVMVSGGKAFSRKLGLDEVMRVEPMMGLLSL